MIIIEIFALCFGFMGVVCPVVDGEPQYWDEDEIWTIYYFPNMTSFLSPQVGPGFFAGTYSYDEQKPFGLIDNTILVITNSTERDNLGHSVLTHELHHAVCRCDWSGHE